ncbi:SGNH hydrolase-type esterase domain-containing protein [Gigaspora rosea]|uniref:SGNH hydrolase-type esterase domain-containing protein n=1 Tax=Gigaspora rosea TaxID=44941 RepID=A0A397UZD4_9GLOM|nr:SGNH hydrolase-type esterase domain-containing protein [Gigaspora rosea]CAG8738222.1 969_t:CDS:1 [Gigaspora rosea]
MLTGKTLFSFTLLLLLCIPFGFNADKYDKIYYISLGDSYAVGDRPLPGNNTTPAYSYANALYDLLKGKHQNLELLKLGISGISSDGLINKELNNATDFMKSHIGSIMLITITIGTNDFHKCFKNSLNHLMKILNNIVIPQLKEAGGENVQYMASTYYLLPSLDDSLIDVYSKNGFKVVDLRTIITNDTMCNYTYWCTNRDRHPNHEGHRVIGEHFYEILGGSLK